MSLISSNGIRATIGIAAPGSAVEPKLFEKGIAWLERSGFAVKCPVDPCAVYGRDVSGYGGAGYTCASVKERTRSIMELYEDDEVEVIICARGGYGSLELLPLLDFEIIRANPKPFVGYSDTTVLLAAISSLANSPSIHGATVGCEFANASHDQSAVASVESLVDMLFDPAYRVFLPGTPLRSSFSEGRLIVGNMTMLLTLLGTPWDVSYDGAILVLEDVGEAPYRVRRGLVQLKLAGKLDSLAGLVFGRFSRADVKSGPSVSEVFEQCVDDLMQGTSYPVIEGVAVGHNGENQPLPWGCRARVDESGITTLSSPLC